MTGKVTNLIVVLIISSVIQNQAVEMLKFCNGLNRGNVIRPLMIWLRSWSAFVSTALSRLDLMKQPKL